MTQNWDYEPYGGAVTGDPPRKGFIDREEDKESALGDFGVRKYDEDIGRFLSTDPLWEKYRAWSPYQYGANSPISISDPSGKEFDMTNFVDNDEDGTATANLLSDLSRITGLRVYIDENNILKYEANSSASNYSSIAQRWLIKAITDPNVVSVYLTSTGGNSGGFGSITIDQTMTDAIASNVKSMDPITNGWGMNLLHEVQHTRLYSAFNRGHENETVFGTYNYYSPVGWVNDVRRQMNLPLRLSYGSITVNGYEVIPFGDSDISRDGTRQQANNIFILNSQSYGVESVRQAASMNCLGCIRGAHVFIPENVFFSE